MRSVLWTRPATGVSLRAARFRLMISLGLEEPKSLSCRRPASLRKSRVCTVSTICLLVSASEFLLGLPSRCIFPASVCLSLNIRLNVPLVRTVALFLSSELLVCRVLSASASLSLPSGVDLVSLSRRLANGILRCRVLSGTEIVLSVSDFLSKLIFSRIFWLTSIEEGFLLVEIKFPMRDLILVREFDCSAWVVTGGCMLGVGLIGSDDFLIMVGRLFEEPVIKFDLTREVGLGGDVVVGLGLVVFVLMSELPRGLPRRRRVKLWVVLPLDVGPLEIVARCLVNIRE